MPARQVHVVLAIAALTFSLATAINAKEVKELQQVLRQCGFDPGPSDGNWGTKTARATADYIRAHGGQPASGSKYSLIWQAQDYIISAGSPCPKNAQRQDASAPDRPRRSQDGQVREIQQTLKRCGFDPGPADGIWGTKTAGATAAYIRAHGGDAEVPGYRNRNNPVVRHELIAQASSYMDNAQPCPAPGGEVWECETAFGTSKIMLKADHETRTGAVRMGTLPPIETVFGVRGLDRLWTWFEAGSAKSAAEMLAVLNETDTVPEFYQFLIGPRGGLGLLGYYFYFPPGTKEDETVESQATYTCKQTSG